MCDSQNEKARGCCNLSHRVRIFHQTVSRLPVANHIFLGLWMDHICQECHSLRSAPERRHTAHLGLCSWGTRETKWPGWGRCIRCMANLEQCIHQATSRLNCSDLGRACRNTHSLWIQDVSLIILPSHELQQEHPDYMEPQARAGPALGPG